MRQARGRAATRPLSWTLGGWVALFSCLLQLLTPLVWAASPSTADPLAGTLVVCTSDGVRLIGQAGDEGPADPAAHRPVCPACVVGALLGILPPPPFVPLRPIRGASPDRPAQEHAAGERPLRLHPVRAPPFV